MFYNTKSFQLQSIYESIYDSTTGTAYQQILINKFNPVTETSSETRHYYIPEIELQILEATLSAMPDEQQEELIYSIYINPNGRKFKRLSILLIPT